jgi:hypothetical protein
LHKKNVNRKNTNWRWKQKLEVEINKIRISIFFKEVLFFNQFNVLFSHSIILFKNPTIILGFRIPSHQTWASLSQFFMMRINQFKFSIPNLYHLKLVVTPITLKIYYISICDPTIPKTWWTRKETWGVFTI